MANAEERHVRPRIDGTLPPSSWWKLINESTGDHYYWNTDTNITQYERPFCLPPIQHPTTCPNCGSNIERGIVSGQFVEQQVFQGFQASSSVRNYPKSSNYSIQMQMGGQYNRAPSLGSFPFKMHQPARPVQFTHNTKALVPHQQVPRLFQTNQFDLGVMHGQQPHTSTVNPDMGFEVNFPSKAGGEYYFNATNSGHGMPPQPPKLAAIPMANNLQNLRFVGAPSKSIGPTTISGLHHMYYSPPTSGPVLPISTLMVGSGSTKILPTERTLVASSASNAPSMGSSKASFYLSFLHKDGIKWYHLNLSGGEKIVKANGSKQELIITLLDQPKQDDHPAFVAVNSSIYRIYCKRDSTTSEVQVLDTESQEGLFAPSWKEFIPLARIRVRPWAVSMGGKIYVVGAEYVPRKHRLYTTYTTYEVNDIEVLSSSKSTKWETLPLQSPKIADWFNYFVVAFEDHSKIVMGTPRENCLYLYDVCTHDLERIDLEGVCYIPWGSDLPPVVVGNSLFFFYGVRIIAYDLVERSFWMGIIDGLDRSFIQASCNEYMEPRLIYLGDGKLCLICFRPRTPDENTSTVHCCVFGVPDFNVQDGRRSLHGHLHSVHKFYIGRDVRELFNVLII